MFTSGKSNTTTQLETLSLSQFRVTQRSSLHISTTSCLQFCMLFWILFTGNSSTGKIRNLLLQRGPTPTVIQWLPGKPLILQLPDRKGPTRNLGNRMNSKDFHDNSLSQNQAFMISNKVFTASLQSKSSSSIILEKAFRTKRKQRNHLFLSPFF